MPVTPAVPATIVPTSAHDATQAAPPRSAIELTDAVLAKIRDAWHSEKPIVPIIGAGFSASSGYPILNSICRYLARFLYALKNRLLLPELESPKLKKALTDLMEKAQHEPIRYLEVFDWPDRYDLVYKVADHIIGNNDCDDKRAGRTDYELIEDILIEQYDILAQWSCSPRAANYWDKNIRRASNEKKGEADTAWDRWAVQGDWRRLIQRFTNFNDDYADALFARFGFMHSPGRGHRYFALLIKLLAIPHIFTFNFDDLIEKSLAMEGVPHRVFGMEHGRTLPSSRVVEEVRSVIKMHGSHHSILIDERLDRPLEPEYIERFYEVAGRNALLLVLGCSADDRRLEDLLAARKERGRNADLCWVHFEPNAPVPRRVSGVYWDEKDGREIVEKEELKNSLTTCPTNSPAAFMRHLLFHLCGRYPTSSVAYPSHPTTPTTIGKPPSDALNQLRAEPLPTPDQILAGIRPRYNCFRSNLNIESSAELLRLATACAAHGFVTIWVDIDSVHTLAGLVAAIIDGCRNIDPELPPAVMPLEDSKIESEKNALDRMAHALKRQRYAVFIDAATNYGVSPLMHHSANKEEDEKKKAQKPEDLARELTEIKIGQSIIALCPQGHNERRDQIDLKKLTEPKDLALVLHPNGLPGRNLKLSGCALVWTCLATFRRTRALPSLRRLISPMLDGGLDDETKVDVFLRKTACEDSTPLKLLEGGDVWFKKEERDEIYSFATRFTSANSFEQLAKGNLAAFRPAALAQSMLMAFLHRKIASTYFSFEFMQSKDANSFLEYTYHRISSVRYFCRLSYLGNKYPTIESFMPLVHQVFSECEVKRFEQVKYFGPLWGELAALIDPHNTSLFSFRDKVREARAFELEALLSSWKEFEQEIRSQLPAEQLLHWLTEIVGDHGLPRLNGVYEGKSLITDLDEDSSYRCERLKNYFTRLQIRICLERGDYKAAENAVNIHASDTEELDLVEIQIRKGEIRSAQAELDRIKKQLYETKGASELHAIQQKLAEGAKLDNLDKIKEYLAKIGDSKERDEKWHRFYHMQCLAILGGRSWIGAGLREGILPLHGIDYGEALNNAEKGIECVRGYGALLAPPLQGMIVSSGSPGGAYLPYRSVFRTLKGRAMIGEILSKSLNDMNIDKDKAKFRSAMKQFDSAKGGLDSQYILLRYWADLHAAEATLLLIRRTSDRLNGKGGDADMMGLIYSKILSCRSHLANAIHSLKVGRRNALWWQQCYQLVAQYHAERLMYDLCKLKAVGVAPPKKGCEAAGDALRSKYLVAVQDEKELIGRGADILRRYDKALDAVAGFADYILERRTAFSAEDMWLKRTVSEVQLGISVATAYYESESDKSEIDIGILTQVFGNVVVHSDKYHPRAFDSIEPNGEVKTYVRDSMDRLIALLSSNGNNKKDVVTLRRLIIGAAQGPV